MLELWKIKKKLMLQHTTSQLTMSLFMQTHGKKINFLESLSVCPDLLDLRPKYYLILQVFPTFLPLLPPGSLCTR